MAININTVSEKLFNILKGFGYEVKSYNKEGKLVINPQEATRFAVAEPNLLARIDVNDKTIVLATSNDLSESPVRGMVKNLAQDYLLNFDYRVFDKKLKPKGENVDIAKNAEKDMAEVMEEINIIRKLSGLDPVEEKVEKDKKYGDEGEKVKTAKGNIYTWAEADRDYSMYGKFTYEGGEFTMYYDPQMGQFDNREPIEGDPKAQQVIDSLPDEYFANDRYGNEKETVISGIIDMILDGGTEEQLEEGKKFPRTSEFLYKKVDALEEIKQLAGVYQPVEEGDGSMGSNISKTANQISSIMKEKNIQPGTPEWFQLWFSKPYLTGEKPYGE